jgi:virulence-associated protein VapD
MGKSAEAPDPAATAYFQGQTNEQTARIQSKLSNADTVGPTGSVTHEWNPDDTVKTTTTLSPGQQAIFDSVQGGEQAAASRMQGLLGSGIDTSGLGGWGSAPQAGGYGGINEYPGTPGYGIQTSLDGAGQGIRSDFSSGTPLSTGFGRMSDQDYGAQRKSVEDAIMSRVQPQYDRDRASQDARLAAQGFNAGSRGYANATDEINRNLTDARMQAVLAGGQEQSRLAGLDQQRTTTNNAALTSWNQATQQNNQNWNDQLAAINSAQGQGFSQNQAAGQFANNAQNQDWNQQLARAGFTNTAQQQIFNQNQAVQTAANNQRAQQLAEQLQLRSQPINEVSSLFGLGNQISVPAATQFQGTSIAAPNYAQMVQNQYAADSANATSTNNAVGSAVATAAMAAATIA